MHRATHERRLRTSYLVMAILGAIAMIVAVGACLFDTKTTACGESGLRCKPGQICAARQDVCIDIDSCGNGVIDEGEVCDDGNIIDRDGCSASCKSDETCGNAVVDTTMGESCDLGPGNGRSDTNCNERCILLGCGNGILNKENEECDPGPEDSPGCNSTLHGSASHCKFARCGDSYVNKAAGEECDNGMALTAECNSPDICKPSKCGDNYHNPLSSEKCDTGGDTQACNGNNGSNNMASCHSPRCGDGYTNTQFAPRYADLSAKEACDDGNDLDCGTCRLDCTAKAKLATAFIRTPSSGSINEGEHFFLSDNTISDDFTYTYITSPTPPPNSIILTALDTASQVAIKTADRVNSHPSLKISALVNTDSVILTAEQLGPNKVLIDRDALNAAFAVGIIVEGDGPGACDPDDGCKFDMDCKSNVCMNNHCQ